MVSRLLDPHIKKEYDEARKISEEQLVLEFSPKIDRSTRNTIDVYIFGRSQTFHENGIFKLKIEFTSDYPTKKPIWKFCEPFPYNSHIYSDGRQSSSLWYSWRNHNPNANLIAIIYNAISVLYQNVGGPSCNPFKCQSIYQNKRELFDENSKKQALLCRNTFFNEI